MRQRLWVIIGLTLSLFYPVGCTNSGSNAEQQSGPGTVGGGLQLNPPPTVTSDPNKPTTGGPISNMSQPPAGTNLAEWLSRFGGTGSGGGSRFSGFGNGLGWAFGWQATSVWARLHRAVSLALGRPVLLPPTGPEGTPFKAQAIPDTLDFGAWATEFVAPELPVAILNVGGEAGYIQLTKAPNPPFYLVESDCPGIYFCMIGVVYRPTTPGQHTDTIEFSSKLPTGATSDTLKITLRGTAFDRKLAAVPGVGGGPHLRIQNLRTRQWWDGFVGDSNSRGGLGGVALGDVTGDRIPDIIVGQGRGGSTVYVLDGNSHGVIRQFEAYPGFQGGVHVGTADVNGDGRSEILIGAGEGGGPHVKVVNLDGGEIYSFFAYDSGFRGGVHVAGGDVNGDGKQDIITGPGPGGGPHLKVFNGTNLGEIMSRFVGNPNDRTGLSVSSGNFDADPHADIVAASTGPVIVVSGATGADMKTYNPYPGFGGAIRVAVYQGNNDLVPDVVTGAGPGGGPHVKVIDGLTSGDIQSFFVYDESFRAGISVGAR